MSKKHDIKIDDQNVRLHDDRNKAAIRRSLEELGAGRSVVADRDGVLIAGNGVFEQAQELGIPHRVIESDGEELIVIKRTDLKHDADKRRALAVADNRTTDMSEFDDPALAAMLEGMAGEMRELAGFTPEELAEMIGGQGGGTEEDEPPEPPLEPKTELGRMYQLGRHRVTCADSTDEEAVKRLMDGEGAAVVMTDPPYGQNQPGVPGDEPENHHELINGAVSILPILADSLTVAFASPRTFPVWLDAVRGNGQIFERMLWLYKEAQCTYPWRGWIMKSEAILISSSGNPEWVDVHPYAHDCYKLVAVQGEIPDGSWHGSIKPLAVVSDILSRLQEGIVYDPFLGSGTTLIAAEQLGRTCFGIELAPRYVDVIVQRYCNLKGIDSERVFNEGSTDE